MRAFFVTTVVGLALSGCGGNAAGAAGEAAGAGGEAGSAGASTGSAGAAAGGAAASTGGSAGAAGADSSGGMGGVAGAGALGGAGGSAAYCEPSAGGAGGFRQPTCADLDGLTVSNGRVSDDGGDGRVSPGETVTVQFDLNETSGDDFMFYPGVHFESPSAGVDISGNDWLYGIVACTSVPLTARATMDRGLTPGTEVRIFGRVGMLNQDCPDTHQAELVITLE